MALFLAQTLGLNLVNCVSKVSQIEINPMVGKLALHSAHQKLGAKLGQFGDWEVPLYYSSIVKEHEAVRTAAGLFDISHMGEFLFEGECENFLQNFLCRDVIKMLPGRASYMPLLNERGGMVDDIIVYKKTKDRFLLIVNAGNIQKDFDFIQTQIKLSENQRFQFKNISDQKGLLALQGPKAAEILERAFSVDSSVIKYYGFIELGEILIARTGYTGEDGFELMADLEKLEGIWDALFTAGRDFGLVPVGFGARDTLRLEAGMPLYGHDMNDDISPLELGIDWAVDFSKSCFVGKDALLEQKNKGIRQKLVGFSMIGRGIPRQDYPIAGESGEIGRVTSGSFSPTLNKNIGMGFVETKFSDAGSKINVMIRGERVPAEVVRMPFYKRSGKK